MSEFHRPGSWGRHSRTWSPGGTLPVGDSRWQQAASTTPPTRGSIFTRIGVSHPSVISPLIALRGAVYLNILVKMRYQLVLLADRPSWAFFPLSSNPPLIQRFHHGQTYLQNICNYFKLKYHYLRHVEDSELPVQWAISQVLEILLPCKVLLSGITAIDLCFCVIHTIPHSLINGCLGQ